MIDDVTQMQINDARKLQRAIAARKAELDRLRAEKASVEDRLKLRPKRYSIEFNFVPGTLVPQTKSFIVDGGTKFRCRHLASSFRVSGNLQSADNSSPPVLANSGDVAQITFGYGAARDLTGAVPGALNYRQDFFEFLWQIRDTGSDRDWQNRPQPSVFMMSGRLSPLVLPRTAVVAGGSEILVTIDPISSVASGDFSAASRIVEPSNYILHVTFFGHEVVL